MNEPLLFPRTSFEIGLYVDLLEGGQLDLRAAAKAALAFDQLVRELCVTAGLDDEIEFNLISGEKGSLNLRGLLLSFRERVRLKAVAIALAGFLGGMSADEIRDQIRATLLGDPEVELSEAAIEKLATALSEKTCTEAAVEPLAQITEYLGADEDVIGLGVTQGHERRPQLIRPRSNFLVDRSGYGEHEVVQTTTTKYNPPNPRTVILTEPILTTSAKRKWRVIIEGGQEVSATMDDKPFWANLVAGNTGLPMAGGVHLDVLMSSTSEKDQSTGAWKEKDFTITKVIDWRLEPVQKSLLDW